MSNVQTNFRAVDMLGGAKKEAAVAPKKAAAAPKPAAKKAEPSAVKVEVNVEVTPEPIVESAVEADQE